MYQNRVHGFREVSGVLPVGNRENIVKWLKRVGETLPPEPKIERVKMADHISQEGKGVFFQQKNKKNPKAPDWKGQILYKGETIRLAAWTKNSSYGELLSIVVEQPKDGQQYPKEVKRDDDCPF